LTKKDAEFAAKVADARARESEFLEFGLPPSLRYEQVTGQMYCSSAYWQANMSPQAFVEKVRILSFSSKKKKKKPKFAFRSNPPGKNKRKWSRGIQFVGQACQGSFQGHW
jgi:hypothetical protein